MSGILNFQLYHECRGEHEHSYPQILIPLEQSLHIEIGAAEYDVQPKELCFIPPALSHQCNFMGPLLVINVSQEAQAWRKPILSSCPVIIPIRDQIIPLVDLIRAELKQNPESKSVHYLYDYLYSKLMESCVAPSIRYIDEYYYLPITIEQLARIESYNASYYCDWFRQQTGCLPGSYLRNIRIQRAKELLTSTSYSVMEIAVMVGYSSNATFTRAFHSATGLSPKAYRDSAGKRNAMEDLPAEA